MCGPERDPLLAPLPLQYWVRPEFVTAIKYMVSQRLPVSLFGAPGAVVRSDAQLVNSVYLDNSALELYHGESFASHAGPVCAV